MERDMTKLNIRDDAKDCPNCGSDCVAGTKTVDIKTGEEKGMKVACFECGALGPVGKNGHDAVIAWNAMDEPKEFLGLARDHD